METNNIEQLKENIRQYIRQNGNKEITGQILQEILLGMVDEYPDLAPVVQELLNKVDKVEGKGLSTEDFTSELLQKLDSLKEVEANPTGEATTPLNTIKIGETTYSIPQTDTSDLVTEQELQQELADKQSVLVVNNIENLTSEQVENLKVGDVVSARVFETTTQEYENYTVESKSQTTCILVLHLRTNNVEAIYSKSNNTWSFVYRRIMSFEDLADIDLSNLSGEGEEKFDAKADKVSEATNGNFAGLDTNGNLTDSGSKATDFATAAQGAKADTAYQKPQEGIPESDLSPDVQSQLNKHFKGWLESTEDLPANPVVGDYAYVEDNGTTYIYRCTNNGEWPDTSIEEKDPVDVTFADGEKVIEVHIINDLTTGGTEDVASAETVKVLGEFLDVDYQYKDLVVKELFSLYVTTDGTITTAGSATYKIGYTEPTNKDRKILVKIQDNNTSTSNLSNPVRAIFLVDSVEEIANGTNVNLLAVPSKTRPLSIEQMVSVPSGKILCASLMGDDDLTRQVVYMLEQESLVAKEIVEENEIKSSYPQFGFGYLPVGEPIPSSYINGIYLGRSSRKILTTDIDGYKTYYFASSNEDRWLNITQFVNNSSIYVCSAFLVDSVAELSAGVTIPLANIFYRPSETYPCTINESVFVPAGKILAISHSTFSAVSYLNVYNTEFESQVIRDVYDNKNRIDSVTDIDSIYSEENPLAIIKETAGYTSIFRTMGVIGGSMSTGWHSHASGSVSANMPQFSSLQFMARLCGATGYNFSRGGMSAKDWPKSDMIDIPTDPNKKCDIYLIQLGNNDLVYHSQHPEYTLGTVSDLTPISGTSIADYTYNASTFFGNMARIINEIRKIQPRAYVFISTFLKGYSTIPADFDYNQAIRDIVEYYTANNGANRPEGDELHYYLIDIYNYGKPYSYYSSGIHAGTVKGSHLVATGYLHWAYEYCTYIDWIIKNNMSDFNDVAFVGTDDYYE